MTSAQNADVVVVETPARRRMAAGLVLGAFASSSAIGLLLTSAWLISRAAQHPPVLYLMVAIVAVRTFGVSRAVFRYAERLVTHDAVLRAMTNVRVRVYERLQVAGPAGLGRLSRGDLISRAVADVDAVQDGLLRGRLPWWTATTVVVATLGFVACLSAPTAAFAAAALIVCWWLVPLVVRAAAQRSTSGLAALRGELATAVADIVRGADELAVFGAAGQAGSRVAEIDDRLARAQRRVAWTNGLGVLIVRLSVVLAIVGAVVLCVPLVAGGHLAPVLLAVVVLAPLGLIESMESLAPAAQARIEADAATVRLDGLASVPIPVQEPAEPLAPGATASLVVRDLEVAWPGAQRPVFSGLSFDVPAGSAVAIVGPSGVGKSTLAWALLRLLDYQSGSISLGGIELKELSGADVRRRIGLLGQDEHVFDTSIRENLRIAAPAADDEQLLRALEQARLLDFVRSLPDGLDTLVGENGERLSGGERQRLGLARLLLGEQAIVILDEPTEHLDEPTAAALTNDLLALAPGRTVLMITHRPHGLDRVDQVVELHRAGVEAAATDAGATTATQPVFV